MAITEQEMSGLKARGFRLLFKDQFEKLPPRVFPAELDRHTIPPISKQLVAHTVTPLYALGWPIRRSDFIHRYGPKESSMDFSDVRIDLRIRWAQSFRNTTHHDYTDFAPEILPRCSENDYVIAILGNYDEEYLKKSLDDDFIQAGASFLCIEGPPKWYRL